MDMYAKGYTAYTSLRGTSDPVESNRAYRQEYRYPPSAPAHNRQRVFSFVNVGSAPGDKELLNRHVLNDFYVLPTTERNSYGSPASTNERLSRDYPSETVVVGRNQDGLYPSPYKKGYVRRLSQQDFMFENSSSEVYYYPKEHASLDAAIQKPYGSMNAFLSKNKYNSTVYARYIPNSTASACRDSSSTDQSESSPSGKNVANPIISSYDKGSDRTTVSNSPFVAPISRGSKEIADSEDDYSKLQKLSAPFDFSVLHTYSVVSNLELNPYASHDSKLCYDHLSSGKCRRLVKYGICTYRHVPVDHIHAIIERIRSGKSCVYLVKCVDGVYTIADMPGYDEQHPGQLNGPFSTSIPICEEFALFGRCHEYDTTGKCMKRHLVACHPERIAFLYNHNHLMEYEAKAWILTPCTHGNNNPFSRESDKICHDYFTTGICPRFLAGKICRYRHILSKRFFHSY